MKNSGIIILFFSLILFFVLIPHSHLFRTMPSEDSGMFLYQGKMILSGFIPYLDTWEHKGPMILYLNALGLLLGFGSSWGVWVLEYIFLLVSSIIGFRLMAIAFDLRAAFFATLLWISSLVLVLDGGNLTEEYNILFQFASLLLFYISEKKEQYQWRGFFIGILGGLSFLLKQSLVGAFATIILIVLFSGFRHKQWRTVLRRIGVMTLGFSLVIICFFIYIIAYDAVKQFVDGFLRFNFSFYSPNIFDRIKTIYMGFWIYARSGIIFLVIPAWALAASIARKNMMTLPSIVIFAIINFCIEVLLTTLSHIHPPHYYMSWLPSMAILIGYLFSKLYLVQKWRKYSFTFFLSITVGTMMFFPITIAAYEIKRNDNKQICEEIGWFLLPSADYFECSDTKKKVSDYVQRNSTKDDYVLIWGFGGSINFISNRLSPTRFTYQFPLFLSNYQEDVLIDEFVFNFQEHQPSIIIDTSSTYQLVPPLEGNKRSIWTHGTIPQKMSVFFKTIERDYSLVERVGDEEWSIYRLKQR